MAVAASTNGPAAPDDLLPALHEEIARLPEKYRLAIVHCDLEGLTQEQAAGQLHWSKRTLQHRLAEGRARLRCRLARRGLAPEGATLGAVLALPGAGPRLGRLSRSDRSCRGRHGESHNDRRGRLGGGPANGPGGVQGHAAPKDSHGLQPPCWRPASSPCGASAVLVPFGRVPSQKLAATPNPPLQRKAETTVPQPGPTSPDPPGKVTVRGRVLGPDGRPVPGAKLYLTPSIGYLKRPYPSPEYATTGPRRPLPVRGPGTRNSSTRRPPSRPRRRNTASAGWRFRPAARGTN